MQSYTTQSHQRNYQGKVVLSTPPAHDTTAQAKQHKTLGKIVLPVVALAMITMGGLLGVTTLHKHPAHRDIQAAQVTEFTITDYQKTTTIDNDSRDNPRYQATLRENRAEDNHHDRKFPHRPIADREHETAPMPSLGNHGNHRR